jgi:predicted transcriptional regulator
MSRTPVVEAHMSLRDLVERGALRTSRAAYPVRFNGRIVGALPVSRLERTPHHEWSATAVGAVMTSLDEEAVVTPDTQITAVMDKIRSLAVGQVFVMQDEIVLGSISRADLADLAAKLGLRDRALAGS